MGGYDADFYARQQDGSLQSARRVLPHLLRLVAPRSIVDVGCGVGTWLKAAAELGVRDLAGLDGAYVDRALLQIPHEQFTASIYEAVHCSADVHAALSPRFRAFLMQRRVLLDS